MSGPAAGACSLLVTGSLSPEPVMPVSVVGAGSFSTDSSISGAGSDFGVGYLGSETVGA